MGFVCGMKGNLFLLRTGGIPAPLLWVIIPYPFHLYYTMEEGKGTRRRHFPGECVYTGAGLSKADMERKTAGALIDLRKAAGKEETQDANDADS